MERNRYHSRIKSRLLERHKISSIVSFKPFLIAWLWEYYTFSDGSVVSLNSSPWPKYTQYGTIFPQKSCSTIELFSSSNTFFIRLF